MNDHIAPIPTPKLDALLRRVQTLPMSRLIREVDPQVSEEEALRVEEMLGAAAIRWRHTALLDAAELAAYAVILFDDAQLSQTMHASLQGRSAHGEASHRFVALILFLLAQPLELDAGPTLTELGREDRTRALFAFLVIHLDRPIGDLDVARAVRVWKRGELATGLWQDRVTRLAEKYERETYLKNNVSGTSST